MMILDDTIRWQQVWTYYGSGIRNCSAL